MTGQRQWGRRACRSTSAIPACSAMLSSDGLKSADAAAIAATSCSPVAPVDIRCLMVAVASVVSGMAPIPLSNPRFPLTLTSAKTPLYCQHRNLAQLRRLERDPLAEVSPSTAGSRGIADGDWVSIATPHGRVQARARVNGSLADGVVATQHLWWQACLELELPGYDALDSTGANINLTIGVEVVDPVSGAAPRIPSASRKDCATTQASRGSALMRSAVNCACSRAPLLWTVSVIPRRP